ncbi:capsule biosynthesis protein [Defluviimonas sp. WL0050]|uniref:Capsule biosynthesis protein n=1 Tax=Albidovulum litorale TaxID=2984134 RepID=A0ABT2ZSR9_9RHOB|nr:capsule biosynthesis protein [Defluviimonas sp. WL0050]MCV2874211.1 capsule biosynthesis protein [Defluviimonas sp. WL0050]
MLKAQRFRIRPSDRPPATPASEPLAPPDDGFGDQKFPTAEQPAAPKSTAEDLAAIRAEGLTGRQLRTARRVAQKNGIEAADDFDAVRLLRKRGIDPFQPSQVMQLIEGDRPGPDQAGRIQLPQTLPEPPGVPGRPLEQDDRASAIQQIQRDIVRRRRRNFRMLLARLAAFVLVPTIVVGWYYFKLATPLYATYSEFIIQQSEGQAANIGSMFRGTQFATSQDSINVQGYLQSRDAMLRLDQDHGFKAHFSQPSIDPLQRLDADATNEAAYKLYKRNVKIGYDPTEGIIKMEIIAADPHVSQTFSEALIGYAEEQVDQLSSRLREDQMQGARDSYDDAERKVSEAQQRVLALQEELGILDPATESGSVMTQINGFEIELQKKRLELQQLLDNARPNQARVKGVEGDVQRLEQLIAGLRAQLTEGGAGGVSLAQVTGKLRIAEADLQTRQLMLAQALQQLETARIEANRQVRYLEPSVRPVAPDEATYPRAFENTVLAFLIFGGIYLVMSLTASILREQATS